MDFPARKSQIEEQMGRLGQLNPKLMNSFGSLHANNTEAGALDTKTKELMALAIAICVHCDGCIAFHVHDALQAGAGDEEILETLGVAVLMGGGPAMVYACDALEALDQYKLNRLH